MCWLGQTSSDVQHVIYVQTWIYFKSTGVSTRAQHSPAGLLQNMTYILINFNQFIYLLLFLPQVKLLFLVRATRCQNQMDVAPTSSVFLFQKG